MTTKTNTPETKYPGVTAFAHDRNDRSIASDYGKLVLIGAIEPKAATEKKAALSRATRAFSYEAGAIRDEAEAAMRQAEDQAPAIMAQSILKHCESSESAADFTAPDPGVLEAQEAAIQAQAVRAAAEVAWRTARDEYMDHLQSPQLRKAVADLYAEAWAWRPDESASYAEVVGQRQAYADAMVLAQAIAVHWANVDTGNIEERKEMKKRIEANPQTLPTVADLRRERAERAREHEAPTARQAADRATTSGDVVTEAEQAEG